MPAVSEPELGNGDPLSEDELRLIDAYWRSANYLSVGQIYLLDNPLLREPLQPEDIKPRLLVHWGTTPRLNFASGESLATAVSTARRWESVTVR